MSKRSVCEIFNFELERKKRKKRMIVAKSIRDLITISQSNLIEVISLSKSSDLICKNIFCEKVGFSCLCKLEHALNSPSLNLNKIKSIDLSFNNLHALPPSIEKMINLQVIDLSGNELKKLPKYFITLEKLTKVDLNGNNHLINSLPLTSLSYEDIKKLPDSYFE